MSTTVTSETNHICDSAMSSALNFCFYVFFCNLKENNQIRRNINNKKKEIFICEIIIIIVLIC